MQDIKAYSQDIKQEALELINKTNLHKLLQQFGEADLGGSFAYDLMVDRDLDYGVAVKTITSEVRSQIASLFASQPWAYSVNLTDRVNFEPLSNLTAPKGLFVGLTIPFPVLRWNVDIWFLVTDTLPLDNMAQLISEATQEQKDTILRIKYELMKTGQKEKGVTSAEVYDAVINQGILKTEDFLRKDWIPE